MTKPTDERLARAAAVLAGGSSVAAAAAEVGVSETTVRRWVRDPRWPGLFDRARAEASTEAGTEAVLVLRSLLRSPDEAVRSQAARALASAQAARDQLAARQREAAGPAAELAEVLAELGDVTAAELREAVEFARALRDEAREAWDRTGGPLDERLERLIETDPAEARRLLRDWHRELCRGPAGGPSG